MSLSFSGFSKYWSHIVVFIGHVVDYPMTVKVHLISILLYSGYLTATEKPFMRAGALGRNMDAPRRAVAENGC